MTSLLGINFGRVTTGTTTGVNIMNSNNSKEYDYSNILKNEYHNKIDIIHTIEFNSVMDMNDDLKT